MATVLTASQRLHNLLESKTTSEAEIEAVPFDPLAVFSARSTEDQDEMKLFSGSGSRMSGTVSRYLAQSPEDLENPTVFRFVSPNPAAAEWSKAGAGLIPEMSIILQKWDGVVLERDETKFSCHLYEGDDDWPVKQAEVDLEELSAEERESVEPGAMFSWMIGYRVRDNTRSRFSQFYFRRLPRWTK